MSASKDHISDFLTKLNSKKMAMPKIEVVKEVPQCTLGEAPHWCPEEQVLYFVDIIKGAIHNLRLQNFQNFSALPPR